MDHPMKSNKSTLPAKGGKTPKVTSVAKSSPRLKQIPGVKISPTATALPPTGHSPSEIAIRAYHNFQQRGSGSGSHTDDWLRAEAELTSEQRLVHA